jgi:hypothetical protein
MVCTCTCVFVSDASPAAGSFSRRCLFGLALCVRCMTGVAGESGVAPFANSMAAALSASVVRDSSARERLVPEASTPGTGDVMDVSITTYGMRNNISTQLTAHSTQHTAHSTLQLCPPCLPARPSVYSLGGAVIPSSHAVGGAAAVAVGGCARVMRKELPYG